jgi:L-malate glycosyltransferase
VQSRLAADPSHVGCALAHSTERGADVKIAFITSMAGVPWGGSEQLWAATAIEALAAGHDVLISVYRWPTRPPPLERLRELGAQIDLRPRSSRIRRSALLTGILRPFDRLKAFEPDVVCVSQGGTYDIGKRGEFASLWRLQRAQGWPYVIACQCEQPRPKSKVAARALRVFERAAVVAFLGRSLQQRTELDLCQPIAAARLIQNPLTFAEPQRLPWPPGPTLRLLFVGRLEPIKGVHLLLEALSGPTWRRRDWQLTIAGEGTQRARLEAQSRAAGIDTRLVFCGFVSDVSALWTTHALLVLPSLAEGMPLVMLEAMLCARPVVATRVGCIADWVEDGRSGYLIERPDSAAIAAALERMWSQRAQLEAIGLGAFERANQLRDPAPTTTLLRYLTSAAEGRLEGD